VVLVVEAGVEFGDVGVVQEHVQLYLPNHVLLHVQLPHLPLLQHLQSTHKTRTLLDCLVHLAIGALAYLAQDVKIRYFVAASSRMGLLEKSKLRFKRFSSFRAQDH
jgi:hypothetical protein